MTFKGSNKDENLERRYDTAFNRSDMHQRLLPTDRAQSAAGCSSRWGFLTNLVCWQKR
jgi:hypothetical protein